ncbi:unnamed protein product [Orchesella dallaii]|uniref:Protein odr-4 n=1 Tax=Orchesella dallaii TaxID=48710 RepID=A0ABP1S0U7_9HEXA
MVAGNKIEVVIEATVRDEFIHSEKEDSYVGLLIGNYTENGSYCVAHKAATLEEDEDSTTPSSSPSPSPPPPSTPATVLTLTPQLISRHAKQVIRMLPGGIQILGLYVIEKCDNLFTQKYEPALKSLYVHLNKGLSRNPFYGSDFGDKNEKLIFHFNPSTKKFNCKAMTDGSSLSSKAVETSFASISWSKLECEYDTCAAMHISKKDVGLPLKKNLNVLLRSFQESLSSAQFFVEGRVPSADTPFVEPPDGFPVDIESAVNPADVDLESEIFGGGRAPHQPGGGGDHLPDLDKSMSSSSEADEDGSSGRRPISPVHILVEKVPAALITSKPGGGGGEDSNQGTDFVSHLHMKGKIAAVAFVKDGDSTLQIVQMLRQDILRSMASRMEMHCESLIDEESNGVTGTDLGDQDCSKVYHEVPRRVFTNLRKSKLVVSDYLFPGEGAKDSFDSFRDLLSLEIENEEDVIITKEKPFDLDEVEMKGSMEELLSKAESISKLPPGLIMSRKALIWVIGLSLLVGLLALCIPFLKK